MNTYITSRSSPVCLKLWEFQSPHNDKSDWKPSLKVFLLTKVVHLYPVKLYTVKWAVKSKTLKLKVYIVQWYISSLNTMAHLPWLIRTRFWVPTKFFPYLNKTNIWGNFLILSWNCLLCVLMSHLIEAILMSTLNIQLLCRKSKRFPKIIGICFLTWRHDKPSVARTTHIANKFQWSQNVRAIEVRLQMIWPRGSSMLTQQLLVFMGREGSGVRTDTQFRGGK